MFDPIRYKLCMLPFLPVFFVTQTFSPNAKPDFLALPGLKDIWYAKSGNPVPSSKLWFHTLHETRLDKGVVFFMLDNSRLVKMSSLDASQLQLLAGIVKSPKSARLQEKYLGKKTWFYGGTSFLNVSSGDQRSNYGFGYGNDLPFYRSRKVKVIYVLQRRSIFNKPEKQQCLEPPARADAPLPSFWANSPDVLIQFSGGDYLVYNLYNPLKYIVSLLPPDQGAMRVSNTSVPLDIGDDTKYFKGDSRLDIAWVYGFPRNEFSAYPIVQKEPMKATAWHCGCCYVFEFKNDKVVSSYEEMSH